MVGGRGKVGKGPRAVKSERHPTSTWMGPRFRVTVTGTWGVPGPGAVADARERIRIICQCSAALLSCAAVPRLDAGLIEVYVFRRRGRRTQFLALRRRPGDSLAGVWQPVTGTLRRGERAAAGAGREVREETGLSPRRLWRLEGVTAFFDPRREAIRFVTLFAAEVGAGDSVRLSREHSAYRFLAAREAARVFLWDTQRQGLAAVRSQVLRGGPRARALEIALAAGKR